MSIQTAISPSTARAVCVPSPLVGEGQGGEDRRTLPLGIPPTPNPSPRHGEAMLRMDGGGEPVEQGASA